MQTDTDISQTKLMVNRFSAKFFYVNHVSTYCLEVLLPLQQQQLQQQQQQQTSCQINQPRRKIVIKGNTLYSS